MVMFLQSTTDTVSTNKLPYPPRQLLFFAVLLPAAVAITNQLMLDAASSFYRLRPWMFAWMVLSTAVLSWCVGRYLQPAWLRWVIFAWSLALLDLLTIAGSERNYTYVLISAQLNLLVLWTILAEVGWQWRLPAAAVAAPIVIVFAGYWLSPWEGLSHLVLLSAVVVLLVCSGLRWNGFLLRLATIASYETSKHESLLAHQFGVKHMLIWAAAVAPLLVVARGLDYYYLTVLDRQSIFPAVLLASCFASVNLIATWAILGAGLWPLRVATLIVFPLLVAAGLEGYSAYYRQGGLPGTLSAAYSPIRATLWNMRGEWTLWLWLSTTLLAALLLFVRANGYRLLRDRRES
jgi:hypothetical protein